MSELSAVKDLVGEEEDDPITKALGNILSNQLGREIKVKKGKGYRVGKDGLPYVKDVDEDEKPLSMEYDVN